MSCVTLRRRLEQWAKVATIVLSAVAPAFATETGNIAALKAAFLYNFAKFTEWPAGVLAAGDALTLCVVNDRAVADALRVLAAGKILGDHRIVISSVRIEELPAQSCNLLYVSGLDQRREAALLEATRAAPVLTLSDADQFAGRGGVAQLFVANGTMGFTVNLDAVQRARILLSSKLLSLARIVKDKPYGR